MDIEELQQLLPKCKIKKFGTGYFVDFLGLSYHAHYSHFDDIISIHNSMDIIVPFLLANDFIFVNEHTYKHYMLGYRVIINLSHYLVKNDDNSIMFNGNPEDTLTYLRKLLNIDSMNKPTNLQIYY